jgi:hypothetical protein
VHTLTRFGGILVQLAAMGRLGFVSMLCVVLMVVHFERISGVYEAQGTRHLQRY